MKNSAIKSALSSSIGNVLEWYEYTLYAYFATVISALFFPTENHYISMMLTFGTFTVSLAARPIGGIIFGYIGDCYSRKKMLSITMLLMSIPTMCIGFLPTYQQIGIIAPIALIILRVIQGVALGGEFGGSCTYLYESADKKRRGFFGTLALTGVGMGLVLSSLTIFLFESFMSQEDIYSYGWRIPFFVSVFGSLIGFYMRNNLLETSDFSEAKYKNQLVKNPFFEIFRKHKVSVIKLFSIFATTQVSFFVIFIFGKSLMISALGYTSQKAGMFNLLTVISYTISTVIFGYLSDKIDKKNIILFGIIGIFISIHPFVMILQHGTDAVIFIFSVLLGMLIGMTEGTLNPLAAETFPVNIRATAIAFCWNFTAIIFGGSAPIISMWLIQKTGNVYSIAYYMMFACVVSTVGVLVMIVRKRRVAQVNR